MARKSARVAAASAMVESGRTFYAGGSGRWAGERLLAAVQAGREISPKELRSLSTLSKDEWINLDTVLVEEGTIRLRGVAALIGAGLTVPVANAMGKTVFQWEAVTDMNPAETSLAGISRTEDDRIDYELNSLPLPITHKDFNLNLRHLSASRARGESVDTTQARIAGRLVAEQVEKMLFQGGRIFGGNRVWGLTNHPARNISGFGAGAWSGGGITGDNILTDVLAMITALEGDRMYGPYWLFVPSNFSMKLEQDFKANSDKTIRNRLLEVDRLNAIYTVDQLPASNVVMVQATKDVVAMIDGEPLQSIQWDVEGGFMVKFKAFTIQVPLIRADAQDRSGVFHMS